MINEHLDVAVEQVKRNKSAMHRTSKLFYILLPCQVRWQLVQPGATRVEKPGESKTMHVFGGRRVRARAKPTQRRIHDKEEGRH